MPFNSLTFLVFFLVVLMLHQLPLSWRTKKWNLLIASYLFYAAWNPPFVVLLWLSTATDWIVGNQMRRCEGLRLRRMLLLVSLSVNLGLLGYFKYAGFVLENFVWLVGQLGFDYQPATPNIILPLGISFYTFQSLSYTFAIYRRHSEPAESLLDFALFVTFFPQLVAGPIVRSPEFLSQLTAPKRANAQQLGWGIALIVLGLFQKIVLSDALLGPIADQVHAAPRMSGTLDAWIGSLAFTGQVYFDFGGYTSCAIGAALCLGFILPENFRTPYAAIGFADFWRRWHITLFTWLRDYVYFSLVSGRRSRAWRDTCLVITMLVAGLWHGASWNFVIWGGLQGLFLVAERLLSTAFGDVRFFAHRAGQIFLGLFTFSLITLSSVFFRSQGLSNAWSLFKTMFHPMPSAVCNWEQIWIVVLLMGATLSLNALFRDANQNDWFNRLPVWLQVPILVVPILCIIAVPGDDRAFIYFQF